MLGFSLPKILLLCLIILIVWYGFKIIERKSSNKVGNEKDSKYSNNNTKEDSQDLNNNYTDADYTEIDEDNER
tara:strand:+ start:253 stop:471 length:219 start_codon:yes stop_codon:yes gene_type:complete